jgi:hypothetical protein
LSNFLSGFKFACSQIHIFLINFANPTLSLSQYGRVNIERMTQKKRGVKVVVEDEPDKEDKEKFYKSHSPPPSPNIIISKESLMLLPDGEAVLQNGHVDHSSDSDSNDDKSDNQVGKA